jgi:uncharacterized protein YndB with AHSA1/START domain
VTIDVRYGESIDIAAPIEVVFAHRLDFMKLPGYMSQCSNIRRTDGGSEAGPGAEYLFDLTLEGMGQMEAYIRVTSMDPPKTIVFDTGSAGMGGTETSTFTELPDGGTHVNFELYLPLPDEAKDGIPFIEDSGRASFKAELVGLKKLLEEG